MRWLAALAALAISTPAAADAPQDTDELEGDYGFSARMRVGTATAPFFAPGLAQARSELSQARSFTLAAHVAAGAYLIGGRLPAAPSTVRQPAGSYADEKSVGNPELFVETRPAIRDLRYGRLKVSLRLAVGLPLADHGEPDTLVKSRALAISDAIDGWLERELYVPGVVPVTIAARMSLSSGPWRLSGRVKLPALIRVGRASLPDTAQLRPLALTPSALARIGLWPTARFGAVAGAWLALAAPAPVALPGSGDPVLQPGLEARALARISPEVALYGEAALPVGGPLDGTATLGIGASFSRR